MVKLISGGVCAPIGYKAAGVHCGVRKSRTKRDLALIYSEQKASAAAVYTQNLVKGAPLTVTKRHLADGTAQAIICNSGNANTCNANGEYIAETTSELLGAELGIPAADVIVASTGVIGQAMTMEPFERGIPEAVRALGSDSTPAAEAIMTTDTRAKEIAVEFTAGGVQCRMGGIAKGSGMIHPNMATMLAFITSDCAISPAMLSKALSADVQSSFNMVTVDGDTSTNDMVAVMANGMAGNAEITCEGADYEAFCEALHEITVYLSRQIAGDGEGATKLLECVVTGARTLADARTVARAVVGSSLLKAAMFGEDANWGRVLCAVGYSGAELDIEKVGVSFKSDAGEVTVCENGAGVDFSEELAARVLSAKEIYILVTLGDGTASAEAWGCDLTYEYVKINGDYRT